MKALSGEERLRRLIARTRLTSSGCWELSRSIHSEGYGRVTWDKRSLSAHRQVYLSLVGPIPAGLEIDHKCRNRRCVNPSHLEAVTHRENCLRGIGPNKTHCPSGHPYTPENTYTGWKGRRCCRKCHRKHQAEYIARRTSQAQ